MKALTCEMCGSTNLIKEDGVFVCQSCNTKYSVEEAKKMMIDGTVEVAGTVKIDTSSELANLYEIARRAKDTDNSENALKYYDMILVKDPNSWEANFYVVYYRAMSCKIAEIQSAAISVSNCIASTLTLIKDNIGEQKEQEAVMQEIFVKSFLIANMLHSASTSHFNDIDISIKDKYVQEYVFNAAASTDIMYTLGNTLIEVFEDKYGVLAAESWIKGIDLHNEYIKYLADKDTNEAMINDYSAKIKKYKSDYQTPEIKRSGGGCYIATAIYGSYDCPEVWVLRRFRDGTLSKSYIGRLFVKCYYATSPSLVRLFGDKKGFTYIFKKPLDRLVSILRDKGVADTPYND